VTPTSGPPGCALRQGAQPLRRPRAVVEHGLAHGGGEVALAVHGKIVVHTG